MNIFRFTTLTVCLLVMLLGACQQDKKPTPSNPDPSDKTAPTLVSSIPQTGQSLVPTNAKLAFTFSEAMDKGSLELSTTPILSVGTPTWSTDNQSVVFANDPLAPSTSYTLTLNAKDVSGNALAATTLSFTSSDMADTTAPTTPTGLVATPGNAQVTLSWQANTESDVAGYTVYWGSTQDALTSSTFVTQTSKTITGLTNDTPYFFAIDALDTANNHSEKTTPVTATPATTPVDTAPKLLASSPTKGAVNVLEDPGLITLTFSKSVDPDNFTYEFPYLGLFTGSRIEWNQDFTKAFIYLTAQNIEDISFTPNRTYTLSFAVKDLQENIVISDKIQFSTGALIDITSPEIVEVSPTEGAVITPNAATITLKFNEEIVNSFFRNSPYHC